MAQREWPMPMLPGRVVELRISTRPFFLIRGIVLLLMVAMPAES